MKITFECVTVTAFLWLIPSIAQSQASTNQCIQLYDTGQYQQAFEPCSLAAESGDAQTQTILGEFYDDQGNADKARDWWEQAAASDYLPARNLLGLKYYYGGSVLGKEQGWEQSYPKAMEIWKQDALRGVATAQFMVGEMYLRGQGVETDLAEAWAWLKLAGNGGYQLANESLGEISHRMSRVERDSAVVKKNGYEKIINGD
jgi:hypothetical protein